MPEQVRLGPEDLAHGGGIPGPDKIAQAAGGHHGGASKDASSHVAPHLLHRQEIGDLISGRLSTIRISNGKSARKSQSIRHLGLLPPRIERNMALNKRTWSPAREAANANRMGMQGRGA